MFTFNSTILQNNTEKKITFRLLPHFGKILLKSSQCDTLHPQWQFFLRLSSKVEYCTCKHSWHSISKKSSQGASHVSQSQLPTFQIPTMSPKWWWTWTSWHGWWPQILLNSVVAKDSTQLALFCTVGLRPTVQPIQEIFILVLNYNYIKLIPK